MSWLNTNSIKGEDGRPFQPYFAIDFDGTLVENAYPEMGKPIEGAVEVIRELMEKGVRIILNTMRTDAALNDAVVYCNKNYIDLYGINENPDQAKWTDSKKLFAHVYIDDRGAGTPLKHDSNGEACVDWEKMRELFVEWEILEPREASDPNVQTFKL